MTNTIFEGLPGQGKTLRAVRAIWLGYHSGYSIVTNLHLKTIPYTRFDLNVVYNALQNDLDLNAIYGAEKIVMVLDEITTLGDSRTALKTENIILSYLFMQARKRKTHIFGTLQNWEDLDKRPRKLVNWRVKCRRIGSQSNPIKFIFKEIHRQNRVARFKVWSADEASKFYPLYDTWQPINPQFLKKK